MSLVFVDTETTGLDPERHEIWEVAAYATATTRWHHWQFNPRRLEWADPMALQLNRYYERFDPMLASKVGFAEFAEDFARLTAAQVLAGIGPWFDARFLEKMVTAWGFAPAWEHRLFPVKAYAAGAKAGVGIAPPFSTSKVAEAYGINDDEPWRHTAVGDVMLALRLYQAVMAEAGLVFDYTDPPASMLR